MPVSALVVTLPQDPAVRSALLAKLQADPRICLGESTALRLAVVAETQDPREDEALFEELAGFDGVVLDLVSYDFSDVQAPVALSLQRRHRRDRPTEGS
jgi:hypothetical protein